MVGVANPYDLSGDAASHPSVKGSQTGSARLVTNRSYGINSGAKITTNHNEAAVDD